MRVTFTSLVLWFCACCFYGLADCSTSHNRSTSDGGLQSTDDSSHKASEDASGNEDHQDDAEDDDNDLDDIDDELENAEERFEKSETELEDAEDVSLKESLEEEESESSYAHSKTDSVSGGGASEDASKERIRHLMDELVTASLELQEINRALDEL
ncbi:hypothetical protein BaOVIS_027960 [Babesia ovis]|uniref:Uncharacterized protein n=1 Tax=Babesia ovis TaxID=5869 RepID=A0A9W5WWG3_BABOV|nr:hypothetical protein BaOVIS_027960 [Babesia ovis]